MLTDAARPRVSRETRRLLAAVGLALVALWILARLRFPERPPSSNPVSPVLTQISPPTTFADLADEVERVAQRIAPFFAGVTWQSVDDPAAARAFPAWPWREDLAIALLPSGFTAPSGVDVVAFDRSTDFALVRVHSATSSAGTIWTPDRLAAPRYLFAATPASPRPSIAPLYISSLEPEPSPAWSTEIWKVPISSGLSPGALVFTAAGEWLGIAADANGGRAIVPAASILDLAMRLNGQRNPPGGDLGIAVQDVSGPIATAIGVDAGAIVAWVDPRGAAAGALAVGDVIEAVNGEGVDTAFAWHVHSTRLAADTPATITVRRGSETHDVTLNVPPLPADLAVLGLTLAGEPRLGSRIIRVTAQTAADRAGLKAGDVVTTVGATPTPTPAQLRRAFDALPDGGTVMLAITRGATHHLVVLTR